MLELYAFHFTMLKSYNGIVEVCAINALHNANSVMGSNLAIVRSKYSIHFQSLSLAHCIEVATTVEQLDRESNCLIKDIELQF